MLQGLCAWTGGIPRQNTALFFFLGGKLLAGGTGWHWVALPCHLVAVLMLSDRRAGSRAGAPNHVPIPEHPWRGQLPWVPSCLHSPCQKQLGAASLGLRLTRCSPYLPARALHHPAGAFCSSPSDGRILGAVACRKASHPSQPEPGAAPFPSQLPTSPRRPAASTGHMGLGRGCSGLGQKPQPPGADAGSCLRLCTQ